MIGIAQGGNPLQWVLHGRMGSTAYMEGANGSINANYQYTPTGQTFLASGGLQGYPFLYTGRDIGPDQNYNNRNREYDPTLYRFMAPDPASFGGGDTNLYAYVRNSPTNMADPLGLEASSSGGGKSGRAPGPNAGGRRGGPDSELMDPIFMPQVADVGEVAGGPLFIRQISTPPLTNSLEIAWMHTHQTPEQIYVLKQLWYGLAMTVGTVGLIANGATGGAAGGAYVFGLFGWSENAGFGLGALLGMMNGARTAARILPSVPTPGQPPSQSGP